jgi:hypothetical protein
MQNLKLPSWIKSVSLIELVVSLVLILYVILPVATPSFLAPYIESPLGMIVLFGTAVALFVNAHILLAVLFVGVAYVLLRRTAVTNSPVVVKHVPLMEEKEEHEFNEEEVAGPIVHSSSNETLEEEVVAAMAPVGRSNVYPVIFDTTFRPIATNVGEASDV